MADVHRIEAVAAVGGNQGIVLRDENKAAAAGCGLQFFLKVAKKFCKTAAVVGIKLCPKAETLDGVKQEFVDSIFRCGSVDVLQMECATHIGLLKMGWVHDAL